MTNKIILGAVVLIVGIAVFSILFYPQGSGVDYGNYGWEKATPDECCKLCWSVYDSSSCGMLKDGYTCSCGATFFVDENKAEAVHIFYHYMMSLRSIKNASSVYAWEAKN